MKLKIFSLIVVLASIITAKGQVHSVDSLLNEASESVSQGYKNVAFDTLPSIYITSSVANVKGVNLQKNFTLNLGNALAGRLSGLQSIQGSSEPGAGAPTFYVRGLSSFSNGNTSPLLIIDGIIANGTGISNPAMLMIPEEIEDVTVLKDAAATAAYGMRGANGAILVTTKRGLNEGLRINFTTRQGVNQAQQLPQFLGAYDYAKLYNEASKNDGVLVPRYTFDDLETYRMGLDPFFHPNINWYDQVLRKNAPVSDYNLNLRGGNNFVKYYALVNAVNSQGIIKRFGDMNEESANAKYSKYNFRTNFDIALTKRLSADVRVAGAIEQISNPYNYNMESLFYSLASLPPNAFPVYNPDSSWGGNNIYSNPYADMMATGFYSTNSRTILSAIKLTEDLDFITKGLSISGQVSINNFFKSGTQKSKSYARYSISKNTLGDTIYNVIGQTTALGGTDVTLDQNRSIVVRGSLDYNNNFGKSQLRTSLMLSTDNVTLYGPATDPSNPDAASTDPYIHNDGGMRLHYVFDDRYLVEGTATYTGSNLFPAGKRYGVFPSGSVAWILSNEKFLKESRTINFLKLRGSYGLTGNNIIRPLGTGRYAYLPTYGSPAYYFGTGNVATITNYSEISVAVNDLTWEKEEHLNIGIDATLFKNLDVSLNVFNRDRKDILAPAIATIPMFSGIPVPIMNLGKANNRGFDADVKYHSDRTKEFQYYIGANITYCNTMVIYNAEPFQINSNMWRTGHPIGQTYGLHAIGFYTPEDIERRVIDPRLVPGVLTEKIQAGDIKYQDIGGPTGLPDGIIDGYDVIPIGKPSVPDLFGGLNVGLKYKGLDLDIVFQGASGNSVYLGGANFWAFQSRGQIAPIALGRWTPETAATATYPRLSATDNLNNYLYSDFWMRDGSYIKLRSAELGYNLPEQLTQKFSLKAFRIFINGTNLFSWDKIPYGDPESLSGYPVLRTLTGGVTIQL